MEMQKYCWLQVIVSFLYYSIFWVAICKIFHGLIWANIRKQYFLSIACHFITVFICELYYFCFFYTKNFAYLKIKYLKNQIQIKNVFLMIGPWLSSAEGICISNTIMVMACILSGHRESKIPDRKEKFPKPHLCKWLEVAVWIHISEGKLRNGPHFQSDCFYEKGWGNLLQLDSRCWGDKTPHLDIEEGI